MSEMQCNYANSQIEFWFKMLLYGNFSLQEYNFRYSLESKSILIICDIISLTRAPIELLTFTCTVVPWKLCGSSASLYTCSVFITRCEVPLLLCLQAELDDLVAAECLYCGEQIIR